MQKKLLPTPTPHATYDATEGDNAMTIEYIKGLANHIRDDIEAGMKPYQSSWDALYDAIAQYKKEQWK